ncbi:MAG: C40 family peptidase [Oscillospiraceae bacterium]|nr:C40 family peptidase [Oscillospiraceae bacterium]
MSKKILALALALTLVSVFCLSAIFAGGISVDAETASVIAVRVAKISARPLESKADMEKIKAAVSTPDETDPSETADANTDDPDPEEEFPDDGSDFKPSSSGTSVSAVGTVSVPDVRLREGAGTDTAILATLGQGAVVSIKGKENGWYKVNYDGMDGYMSADFVEAHETADNLTGYVRVETDVLNMRAEPNAASEKVCSIAKDMYITVTGFRDGWYAVTYTIYSGYMSGDYLTPVAEKPQPKVTAPATSASAAASSSAAAPAQSATTAQPDTAAQVNNSGSGNGSMVDYAMSFLGVPYRYGGASPSGFDCSGFTMYVYSHFGYSLPHGSNGQYRLGTPVDRASLVAGDLVFFLDYRYGSGPTSHVGLYIGDGQFIHATSNGGRVRLSSLNDSYYRTVYVGGRHFG